MIRRAGLAALLLAPALAGGASAAPPTGLADARIELASDGDPGAALARFASTREPVWIGWSAPGVDDARGACCWNEGGLRSCSLGRSSQGWGTSDRDRLSGPSTLILLVRAIAGRVDDARMLSTTCPIDGDDQRVVWLDGADPDAGLALLDRLERSREVPSRVRELLLAALAHVARPRAAELLAERADDPSLDRETRKNAVFWTGEARGDEGVTWLLRFLGRESDEELREQALFALAQTRSPRAREAIERTAVEDRDPEVRSKAYFWLSQTGAPGVGEWISGRIAREPDPEVREQAVFALSQLDDGSRWLIAILRGPADRALQRQALFWLGQSNDPRALDEFARILDAPVGKPPRP